MTRQTFVKLILPLFLGIITLAALLLLIFAAATPDNRVSVAALPSGLNTPNRTALNQNCVVPGECTTPSPSPLPTLTPTPVPPGPTATPEAIATTTAIEPTATAVPEPTATPEPPPPTPVPIVAVSPSRIRIPNIGVDAFVEHVGLTKDGAMDTPHDFWNTAWYKLGAMPGEPGNAVIAGHVDYITSVAVFWNLKKLQPGNKIYIKDDKGTELVFEVYEVESYHYTAAPLDRIFGAADTPQLNLITCTGNFDRKTANYDQRLVIYSRLINN